MSFVATLIANPNHPAISPGLANRAKLALKSTTLDWLATGIACDIDLPDDFSQQKAVEILENLIDTAPIDFAIQKKSTRRKKALIADMDSTMIDQECVDELASEAAMKDRVAAITKKAMNGEIEFETALRDRVAFLKDLPEAICQQVIAKRITLASGGKILVATMRKHGAYCALVSGGFTLFTAPIGAALGFDENRANILLVRDGKLTGKVAEPILGSQAKVDALNDIAKKRKLQPQDFIAVGDGANDLSMLQLAGTGVALHAKQIVATQAKIKIDHGDLTALLYLQGYRIEDFVKAW